MKSLRLLSLVALLATLAPGCRDLEYTADGTPIVPFDARAEAVSFFQTGAVSYEITLEVWTDRMPTVSRGFERQSGFPCYVALQFRGDGASRTADEIWAPALSLWSPRGESLLVSFPLVGLDGQEPLLRIDSATTSVQFTNDRKRPRYTVAEPEEFYLPRLLIMEGERSHFITLPPIHITAAH